MHRVSLLLAAIAALAADARPQSAIPFSRTPDYESDRSGVSTGGTFADLNLDGWPDLVIANGNDIHRQQVVVYYNRGDGTFPTNPDWRSSDIDYHGHLAVGDVNGDGWPDVAVAVFLGPRGFGDPGGAKLYLNNQGTLGSNPAWRAQDHFFCFSVALGDMNGDGDLDLAVATGEPYSDPPDHDRVYLNRAGLFSTLPDWTTASTTHAMDVAWCDADGDGDLDLAFAGAKGPNRYYANAGGTLPASPTWVSTDGGGRHNSNSCSFGDADGDGRPDLAISDNNQLTGGRGTFRIYRNLGTTFSATPWWESNRFHSGMVSALEFLDFDLDGDQDLVAGGWWTQTSIYRNQGGTLPLAPTWETSGTSVVEAIFFADVNRDGLRAVSNETKTVGGGRTLFSFDYGPVQSLQSATADGIPLAPSQYALSLDGGWISLATAPTSSLSLAYTYTEAADMGVSNWDSSKGNYLFYRAPLVTVGVTPPSPNAFRAGQVVSWTEHFATTSMSTQFVLYRSFLDLPHGYGALPFLQGAAFVPGNWSAPAPLFLAIPSPFPSGLLGTYTYRVELVGPDLQTVISHTAFNFDIIP